MALREIITEADERLRKRSRPIEEIDHPKIQTLIDDMIDTLHASGNGIGLAAVQVGVLRRLFIIDMQEGEGPMVYINPVFELQEGEQCQQEGCLSLPDYWAEVKRPARVRIAAYDRYGKRFVREATGLEAICICHEADHLDGILFKDRALPEAP